VPILGSYINICSWSCWCCRWWHWRQHASSSSATGYGFATIRDDEIAAEACGVPTLRLAVATTISGALMGMAGAPFLLHRLSEPSSAFGLLAVSSIAMPGSSAPPAGSVPWSALLLGTLQQVATVTISSPSILIVGLLLVGFVIVAPKGHHRLGARLHARANLGQGQPTGGRGSPSSPACDQSY
jgi:branched-chain amino acid transport system permease protein